MTKSTTSTFLLLLLLLPAPGCLFAALVVGAAAATIGTISYTNNGAQEDFKQDLETVWQACIVAAKAEGYAIQEDVGHKLSEGVIKDKDLSIRVERHPGEFTRVLVRIGTFKTDDHKRKAKLILERVEEELN